jgi:uncharacterized 2Fe-2S/4Fe-4S cluster protein (DUF4445 family)
MQKFKVKFVPDNKTVEVPEDTTILSAALSCGLYINSACGGEGVCGRCRVILKKGRVVAPPEGALTPQEKSRQTYLACLTTVHSDIEVEVPSESRLDFENLSPQELKLRLKGLYAKSEEIEPAMALAGTEEKFSRSPLTEKLYLKLTPPDLKDRISDLERLYREIQRRLGITIIHTGLANIKQLGELLRDSDWQVTVTLGRKEDACEVINIEPGDTAKSNFGLSFDIGTTTITGQLIDLNSQEVLGARATYNKQAAFGSDVITRIIFSQEEKGLEKLHNTLTDTVNLISRQLIEGHRINLNDVTCILCAGNTTMIHLLLGVEPKYIRREPYVPTANFLPVIRASEAGININPHGLLQCVPGVASYVGGDTTAGLLSSGIYRNKELGILIDIGTNGEIALGNEEFLIAAAASAGPAFEGSGLTCGMRSSRGAIQKVRINPKDPDINYETIGGTKPRGICGSGYVDILASMLRAQIIDKNGKFVSMQDKRIRAAASGREFVLAPKQRADSTSDIVISEADIENLKRSKAAIYSAVSVLVRHMSLEFGAIKKIFIAGGFGAYLDIENAVTIGLLPDLPREKFVFIGNSALAGARRMLLSQEAAKRAGEIARKVTYFELSVDASYMDEYTAALFFPHTDLNKFPSVRT